MSEKYTAYNDVTGALLKSKPSTQVYEEGLEIIQQNNKATEHLSCDDCVTIPCPLPKRKECNYKCSFFETTKETTYVE